MVRLTLLQLGIALMTQGFVGVILQLAGKDADWGVLYLIDRFVVDLPDFPAWVTWAIAFVGVVLTIPWLAETVPVFWRGIVRGPNQPK